MKTPSAKGCILVLLALCAGPPSRADTPNRRLSRVEAIQLGLSRNLGLLVKRLEQRRQEALGGAAYQAYSPTLFLDGAYHSLQPDAVTPEQRYLEYSLGAGWKSPLGTTVSAQVQMDQAMPGPADPVHASSVSLSVVQPLLKNAGWSGAALPLSEARFASLGQRELYKGEVNRLIVDVEAAYWDLAVAQADVTIKTRSLARAGEQFQDTVENIRRGILADAERFVVEENVNFFEQELLLAQARLVLNRRGLAQLLALPPDAALEASDELLRPDEALPDRRTAADRAHQSHPALLSQRLAVELAATRVAYWRNQALPSLNVNASVGLRGWDEQYQSAWSQLLTHPVPDARAGLTLGLALDRSAVGAALDSAEVSALQQQAELNRQEDAVRFEVENACTDLEAYLKLLSLAQKQVLLAELKLKAQHDKYQSGLSTLADVVRFQRDLDNALIAAQRVMRTVRVGQARLLASQGTLYQSVGAEVR